MTNMKGCIWITLIFFLSSVNCHALSSSRDGKKEKMENYSRDTLKVYNLLQSFEQTVNSDEELATKYCFEALDIAHRIGYKHGEGVALKDLGALYQYKGLFDSCRNYYTLAKKVFTSTGDTNQIAAVMANIASSYYDQGSYVKSLAGMDSVRNFLKNRDYGVINAFADNTTGSVYLFQGYYTLAAEYKSKAREYFASVGDDLRTADTERDLGNIFSNLGEDAKALDAYYKCAAIYKGAHDQRFLGEVYLNIGDTYTETGKFDSARYYLNNGIKLLETTGFSSEVANGEESLGYLAKQQGRYPESLKLFSSALKHAITIGDESDTILHTDKYG